MKDNNGLLKTIFTSSILTIAGALCVTVIVSRFSGLLPLQTQKSMSGWVVVIGLTALLINWRWCLRQSNKLAIELYDFNSWCYANSTFCFVVGLCAGLMCVLIGMQMLINLHSYYLTLIQGACFVICLLATSLMVPAWEKKFGPL